MGVVLAELILLMYRCQRPDFDDYKVKDIYMFPGNSCFPHSPCKEMKEESSSDQNIVSKHDQLMKILGYLGQQSAS